MTEEEAKTKWCPQMAMHSMACDETCRREGKEYAPGIIGARCIGSACMAWRERFVRTSPTGERITTGHCGLAGKP